MASGPPLFMPYELFLLGLGVVFNLLKVLSVGMPQGQDREQKALRNHYTKKALHYIRVDSRRLYLNDPQLIPRSTYRKAYWRRCTNHYLWCTHLVGGSKEVSQVYHKYNFGREAWECSLSNTVSQICDTYAPLCTIPGYHRGGSVNLNPIRVPFLGDSVRILGSAPL